MKLNFISAAVPHGRDTLTTPDKVTLLHEEFVVVSIRA